MQGYDDVLINRALHGLAKAAIDTSRSLYDRNRDVYDLLRYGVKVRPEIGEHAETVWLIDWKNPSRNAERERVLQRWYRDRLKSECRRW